MQADAIPDPTDDQREQLALAVDAFRSGDSLAPPWCLPSEMGLRGDLRIAFVAVDMLRPRGARVEEPWLLRGTFAGRPPKLRRLSIEHFDDPDRELTGEVIRCVKPAALAESVFAWLADARLRNAAIAVLDPKPSRRQSRKAEQWAIRASAAAKEHNSRPGRPPISPEFLRALSVEAIQLFELGDRHVVRTLAAQRGAPVKTVSHWIYKAREAGFLAWSSRKGRQEFLPGPNLRT